MFPLDRDVSVTKAMVSYRQEQVRASFPRKITRWVSPPTRRVDPTSATATPRLFGQSLSESGLSESGLIEPAIPEPRLPQQSEQKYVA